MLSSACSFFFFNDTATTEIYTLSLHDALPISTPTGIPRPSHPTATRQENYRFWKGQGKSTARAACRSEEHTSELQSLAYLVCRLLLEKKKKNITSRLPIEATTHSERPFARATR